MGQPRPLHRDGGTRAVLAATPRAAPRPRKKFISTFLKPPLYSTAFAAEFGTLYTAVYRPRKQEMEIRWPGVVWPLSLARFQEGARAIHIPGAA
jgi:hypothetical protein